MADDEATEVAESTDDEMSLSQLFEDEPEAKAEVETKGEDIDAAEDVKAPELDVEGESKVEPEQEEPEPERPKAETPSAEQGQLAALLAERQRRQEAERKLAELEGGEPEETELSPDTRERKVRIELSRDFMLETDPEYAKTYEPYFMSQVVDAEGNIRDEDLCRSFTPPPVLRNLRGTMPENNWRSNNFAILSIRSV